MYLTYDSKHENKLYDILNDNDIDYDIQEAGLWIEDDDIERTKEYLKDSGIQYEFDKDGYEDSVVRILAGDMESAEEALNDADIKFDYDDGGRIMIPGSCWKQAQEVLDEEDIDYDEI